MENKLYQEDVPKRPKLIKPLKNINYKTDEVISEDKATDPIAQPDMRLVKNQIESVAELRYYLRVALQLELSTIPPYLCGLYSIEEGSNQQAAGLIRSVVVEEMLHMVLVANILNAISKKEDFEADRELYGDKLFNVKEIIPNYPTPLPGNINPYKPPKKFIVGLLKFSQEAVDEFCTIEMPTDPKKPLEKRVKKPFNELKDKSKTFPKYKGIGQFYEAIRYGLYRFKKDITERVKINGKTYYKFIGDESRQVGPEHYYGSGGKILKVDFFGRALEAIEEIVGQGEGVDGTIQDPDFEMFGEGIEVAHFFKFREIHFGKSYQSNDTNYGNLANSIPSGPSIKRSWTSVYNMKPNPKMEDYKNNPQLMKLAHSFNATYVTLLNNINDAVSGDPAKLIEGITVMYDLKYKAQELMKIPLGKGLFAGPTFEYVQVKDSAPPKPAMSKTMAKTAKTPVAAKKKK